MDDLAKGIIHFAPPASPKVIITTRGRPSAAAEPGFDSVIALVPTHVDSPLWFNHNFLNEEPSAVEGPSWLEPVNAAATISM
jgi:hypothetical protein